MASFSRRSEFPLVKENCMKLTRSCLPCVAGLLLLSACATDGGAARVEKAPVATLEIALAEADTAIAAGQNDKAQAILKSAATNYPADKAPWLHIAQMKFDRASYGEAISNALEALQRDPADKLGNSIVAVSGLRLSTKALADLSQQNNLNGSLRSEAQDLAKLLRSSLGEDLLVPSANPAVRKPTANSRKATAAGSGAPAANGKTNTQSVSNDPFGGLK
jgi:tetratricopeptide (TPR) repeat protein